MSFHQRTDQPRFLTVGPLTVTTSPLSGCTCIRARPRSISAALRIPIGFNSIPKDGAAPCIAAHNPMPAANTLTERNRQSVSKMPEDKVGVSAWRKWNDDGEGPRRIRLCDCIDNDGDCKNDCKNGGLKRAFNRHLYLRRRKYCVTCSDYAMGCIEGIQLTIFVELANKLVINEVRHRYIQHARIMDRYHCLHLCQRRQ